MDTPIKIGVSSCLLGNPVRYDGAHQLDPFIIGTLGRFVTLIPVCPELECGLGAPRETMRLVGDSVPTRLVTTQTGIDHSERMYAWAGQRLRELEKESLAAFIFKGKSPSCGLERVKVYPKESGGRPRRIGSGLFARAFTEHFPLLPVIDEVRLHDLDLRENFIEQIFLWLRWRSARETALHTHGLIAFHSTNKLQVLAHSERHYRAMGRLVAHGKDMPIATLFDQYQALLFEALRRQPTVTKQCNVLLHTLGYFKKQLAANEREAVLTVIEQFRQGEVPHLVPITLLYHHGRACRQESLLQQSYLSPHPLELKLRAHA